MHDTPESCPQMPDFLSVIVANLAVLFQGLCWGILRCSTLQLQVCQRLLAFPWPRSAKNGLKSATNLKLVKELPAFPRSNSAKNGLKSCLNPDLPRDHSSMFGISLVFSHQGNSLVFLGVLGCQGLEGVTLLQSSRRRCTRAWGVPKTQTPVCSERP